MTTRGGSGRYRRTPAARASWASLAPAADRAVKDRRFAGLDGQGEVAAQVVELVRDRAEGPVVVEPGLADCPHPLVGGELHDPRPARIVDPGGVVGVDADRRVEPGHRPTRSRARSDEATSQPGTRIRSTPARRAAPATRTSSVANRSALR